MLIPNSDLVELIKLYTHLLERWPDCRHNCRGDWSCGYHWSKVRWFELKLRQLRFDLQSKIHGCTKVAQLSVNHRPTNERKSMRFASFVNIKSSIWKRTHLIFKNNEDYYWSEWLLFMKNNQHSLNLHETLQMIKPRHIGRSIITRYDKSDCCVRTCLSNVLKMFYKSKVKRMESIV